MDNSLSKNLEWTFYWTDRQHFILINALSRKSQNPKYKPVQLDRRNPPREDPNSPKLAQDGQISKYVRTLEAAPPGIPKWWNTWKHLAITPRSGYFCGICHSVRLHSQDPWASQQIHTVSFTELFKTYQTGTNELVIQANSKFSIKWSIYGHHGRNGHPE